MENEQSDSVVLRSPNQEVLVSKILYSKRIKDKEFQDLKSIWENQVTTMKDASVFIEFILATLRFRRMFLSEKFKSFKICRYCDVRDNISRIEEAKSGKRFWCCETCLLNLDSKVFVLVPRKSNNGKR